MKNIIINMVLSKWPVAARYLVSWLGVYLVAKWGLTAEQWDLISPHVDAIIGGVFALTALGFGLKLRPSDKALKSAHEIDKKLDPSEDVVIKTPGKQPDIIVPADDKSGR